MMCLCRDQPRFLLETLGVSLLVWAALLGEYVLMLQFVGLTLNLAQVILALTLARLAFLVPLPGGLGALEASQVAAMELLGFSPALGISLCLIIRARDLVLGGAGLGIWGWTSRF
jgi:glycosyltransferase 2 family protein